MRCDWPVTLVPQVSPQLCWVAATSMLLGHSIRATGAWVGPTGGLHHQDAGAMQQFLNAHRLRAVGRNMSLEPQVVQRWLCQGPVMLVSGFRTGPHAVGTHALVIAGMDDDVFRVLDPAPAGRGTEIAVNLREFSRFMSFNVFWAIQKM